MTKNTSCCEPLEAALELERNTLGAAILDPSGRQAAILAAMLREQDFLLPLHRSVFRVVKDLVETGDLPLEYGLVIAKLLADRAFQSRDHAWSCVAALGDGVVLRRPMTRRIERIQQAAQRRMLAQKRDALLES